MQNRNEHKTVPVLFPPHEEIFGPNEIPVIEISEKYVISYGDETLFGNWLRETFGLEIYEPPKPHEKIQHDLEKLINKKGIKGIENLKLNKILLARDNSWGMLLSFKFPYSMPVVNEKGEVMFYLRMVTPYFRESYIISNEERGEIDLAEIVNYAPRLSFENFLERIFNYYERKSKEMEQEVRRYIF